MHIKTIASAAAISLAMGFGSFAIAQDAAPLPTTFAGAEISAEDALRVKVVCDDLQTAENQAVGTSEETTTEDPAEEAAEDASDPAAVGSVDFDSITLENCIEFGFLEAPAM